MAEELTVELKAPESQISRVRGQQTRIVDQLDKLRVEAITIPRI